MMNLNRRNRQAVPAYELSNESVDGSIFGYEQIKTRPLGAFFTSVISKLVLNNFIGGAAQLDISPRTRIGVVGRYRAAA